MKENRRWSFSFPMIALLIPITVLFQNCSPGDLEARNSVIRPKAETTKAAYADFKK